MDIEMFGFSEMISLLAVIISLAALVRARNNRIEDIARNEAYRIRVRVWEVLNGEAGLRSVNALDDHDGKTRARLALLERTALQLKAAGAPALGDHLENVLNQEWPAANEASTSSRSSFHDAVVDFMKP